jgi:Sigma-70 region 2
VSVSDGSGDMVIRLRIGRVEPLAGTVVTEDGAERAFSGWMELIGAIAELIGGSPHARFGSTDVHRLRREGHAHMSSAIAADALQEAEHRAERLAGAEHRAELAAFARRMLGSAFEAEDAVQETMLRAWRSFDGFEGRSSLRSWLYRITANVCLDMLHAGERMRDKCGITSVR